MKPASNARQASSLTLWQKFYGGVLARRRERASRTAHKLPRPVVSVGNLHWGGGGKTPMTAAITRHLLDQGLKVTVLSRGHGRRSKGALVVSLGEGALVPVDQSGDEPALLAREPGLAVVVAKKRYEAGLLALETRDCDVFILDDGFSHVALARDIELLVFPRADLFGGGKLLPSGRLREPLSAATHADALVLTGQAGQAGQDRDRGNRSSLDEFSLTMATHGWDGPIFGASASVLVEPPRPIGTALLACAVARPKSVERTARELAASSGFKLVETLTFPDHHRFPRTSLRKLEHSARSVDTVLVTGKDLVKLEGRLRLRDDCQLVEIKHRAEPALEFLSWLDDRLSALLD